jgi:hypothetical protein
MKFNIPLRLSFIEVKSFIEEIIIDFQADNFRRRNINEQI